MKPERSVGATLALVGALGLAPLSASAQTQTSVTAIVAGANTTAASTACNGDTNAACDASFEAASGLAYDTTVTTAAGSYTFNGWRDVLRVLLAGFDHDNTGTDAAAWAARDCSSAVRQALANNWSNLFENNCSSPAGDTTGTCTSLRHVFRSSDSSVVTETLVALLGLPPVVAPETALGGVVQHTGASPFCNVVRPGFVFASPPTCLQGTDATWDPTSSKYTGGATCPGQLAVGANNVFLRETAVYRAPFQDNDPIRRTCVGSGAGTAAAEDVCSHSGDLGLVLPMNDVPEETLNPPRTNTDRYNPSPCYRARLTSVAPPEVYDALSQTRQVCTRGLLCPNGDQCNALGGCLAPADANGNTQCLATKLTAPGTTISLNAVPAVHPVGPGVAEGRAFNQHLYVQVGSAGKYQTDAVGLAVTGAFYRIHTAHSLAPVSDAGPSPKCQLANANDQIGCLVAASPCSLGAAGVGTLTTNGSTTGGLKLAAQSPVPACVAGGQYPATVTTTVCATTCPPGLVCGSVPDGCGGAVQCGTCPTGEACTAQNTCCTPTCAPGACGVAPACAGFVFCGSCPTGEVCTSQHMCCTPGCAAGACGLAPDGCGGTINCGGCPTGEVCTSQNTCCQPISCPAGACGPMSDGCGGTIDCSCPSGQVCTGSTCCQPLACPPGNQCGNFGDGCGGTVSCGTCAQDQVCVGEGSIPGSTCQNCPTVCCQPATACPPSAVCGDVPDGCGGWLHCGPDCPAGQVCGGDNTCHDAAAACTPAGDTIQCLNTHGGSACVQCAETAQCFNNAEAFENGTCETVPGTQTHFSGPLPDGQTCAGLFSSATESETQICLETLAKGFAANCIVFGVGDCVCGPNDPPNCLFSTPMPTGALADSLACDMNTTVGATLWSQSEGVLDQPVNNTFGGGRAVRILSCLAASHCACR
jgi:hypothetical protein